MAGTNVTPSLQDYSALVDYPVQRKLLSLLDGRHQGVGAGTSHEFLDVAEYRPGDDMTSIDWKATARMGQPIVKRFEATAVLNVVLAVDGGSNMAALAPVGEPKQQVVRELITAIAWLIAVHGDHLGLVVGDQNGTRTLPARAGLGHAETLIRVASAQQPGGAGPNFTGVLRTVAATSRRRSLVFGVTDQAQLDAAAQEQITKLATRHEVALFLIEDLDPTTLSGVRDLVDVAAGPLAGFVEQNQDLQSQWRIRQNYSAASTDEFLARTGVARYRLASGQDVLPALVHVLKGVQRGPTTA